MAQVVSPNVKNSIKDKVKINGSQMVPNLPDPTQLYTPLVKDLDYDGLPMMMDNCPSLHNPGQEDQDGDKKGDLCDVPDKVEGCFPQQETKVLTGQLGCRVVGLDWKWVCTSPLPKEYRIYRNGVWVGLTANESWADQWVPSPSTNYNYVVAAVNSFGNVMGTTKTSVTVPACTFPLSQINTKVLYVQFNDFEDDLHNASGELMDAGYWRDLFFDDQASLSSYLQEVSYQRTKMVGDVHGPIVLPGDVSDYCSGLSPAGLGVDCDVAKIRADIFSATFGTINYSGVETIILLMSGYGDSQNAMVTKQPFAPGASTSHRFIFLTAQNFMQAPGVLPSTLIFHEWGHTLGVSVHAGTVSCPFEGFPSLYDLQEGGCDVLGSSDPSDPMGKGRPHHYSSYHKEVLGFLNATQVAVLEDAHGVHELTIDALEVSSDGIKMLKIPLGGGAYYFLEYRKRVGFFDSLANLSYGLTPIEEGVHLRLRLGGQHGLPIDMPDAPVTLVHRKEGGSISQSASLIKPGKPFVDESRNLRIEVLEAVKPILGITSLYTNHKYIPKIKIRVTMP